MAEYMVAFSILPTCDYYLALYELFRSSFIFLHDSDIRWSDY